MAKKTIGIIVEKQMKQHRTEVVLLWFIIAVGVFLIPAGIGVYFNVGKLPITQYIFAITRKNVMVDQVRMLYDLSRGIEKRKFDALEVHSIPKNSNLYKLQTLTTTIKRGRRNRK